MNLNTSARRLFAIRARIKGEWDNIALKGFPGSTDLIADILALIDGTDLAPINNRECLAGHGFKLVTRDEFESADDLPPGLLERASSFAGSFVVYDPEDDSDGWLLVGDDAEALAEETAEKIDSSIF